MRSRRRTVLTMLAQSDSNTEVEIERVPQQVPQPMARKNTVERNKESTPPAESRVMRLRRSLVRPKWLLLVGLGAVAVVFGPRISRWLPDPSNREEYAFRTAEMEINAPPRDVPPNFIQQVMTRSKLPKSISLLDDDLTQKLAAAFAAHPWVEKVVSVRKSFPPRIVVELAYRHPVAMVEVPDGLYPVDRHGVLLPPEDFSLADTQRLPVVRNIQTHPRGPAGLPWGDLAVHGAARLAVALKGDWQKLHLEAIRPADGQNENAALEDLKFVLLARGGSRIVWGRAPGTNHPGELRAEQKIGRLKKYLSNFGDFGGPQGPYEIDIRHWQEITRRPITSRRGNIIRR